MSLLYNLAIRGIPWMPESENHPDYPIRNARRHGDVVYTSGKVSLKDDKVLTGKIGGTIGVTEGAAAAASCALHCLYAAGSVVDGDDILGILRMQVDVNCTPDFKHMSEVADGASRFLIDLFGEEGRCARTAIAAMSLLGDAMVEITMEVLVKRRSWWRRWAGIFRAFRVA